MPSSHEGRGVATPLPCVRHSAIAVTQSTPATSHLGLPPATRYVPFTFAQAEGRFAHLHLGQHAVLRLPGYNYVVTRSRPYLC
jgi:hypothetical protein